MQRPEKSIVVISRHIKIPNLELFSRIRLFVAQSYNLKWFVAVFLNGTSPNWKCLQ